MMSKRKSTRAPKKVFRYWGRGYAVSVNCLIHLQRGWIYELLGLILITPLMPLLLLVSFTLGVPDE